MMSRAVTFLTLVCLVLVAISIPSAYAINSAKAPGPNSNDLLDWERSQPCRDQFQAEIVAPQTPYPSPAFDKAIYKFAKCQCTVYGRWPNLGIGSLNYGTQEYFQAACKADKETSKIAYNNVLILIGGQYSLANNTKISAPFLNATNTAPEAGNLNPKTPLYGAEQINSARGLASSFGLAAASVAAGIFYLVL
ncbi:hypothetical protein DFS34DRAFT_613788 [Phlyctochytrium arcticum]|nr:hypothetical protein DFS34DRAFT_613788 [Phlyctochytrium arcticum]